ncbi:hypothetical protein SPRG_10556 [Saprolegnia parasitica CBS 223.65]|uniref:Sugar transporter SWEET1 n=1 Tax=Saprolegnia parasitica (strain CBS 223.65) TaxID=695850 RepID=A0A067BZ42_SAPPC|nr:hypothetical protein SPRG_10556 [Saprolegnia parasitica CBS 223.65]KDO23779.1 hypothetical protein SPRG_10556 [Saprolegnia parasitica CBS 223.65]|eukprot:XP_012205593.1 hypothetical protein SPRG_10556 [Saprolegnia parasitica CBS 223.65]
MVDASLVVQIVASLSSLYLLLSPISLLRQISVAKTTGSHGVAPLLWMHIAYVVWLLYSLCVGVFFPYISTNMISAPVSVVYLVLFYKHSAEKTRLRRVYGATTGGLATLAAYVALSSEPWDAVTRHVGVVAIVCAAVMVAAPLSVLRDVVRTRSSALLPRRIMLATLVSNGAWLLTGLFHADMIIVIPNAFNLGLGLLQMTLFLWYPH